MANFIPSKHEASEYNNGVQYVNNDIVQPETINNLVESALYTQNQAETAKNLVNSVVVNAFAPPLVGMHHIQFSGEPTPAEIWGGTAWVIDTDYQARTIIGSGGDYLFGNIGGEESHTLTVNEIPSHNHRQQTNVGATEGGYYIFTTEWGKNNTSQKTNTVTSNTGGNQSHNIMQPYKVVNIWKRTA